MTTSKKTKVRFDTVAYECSYGHSPGGRGSWAFVVDEFARLPNYLDFVWWAPSGTYGEAKKAAVEHFRNRYPGRDEINVVVCT